MYLAGQHLKKFSRAALFRKNLTGSHLLNKNFSNQSKNSIQDQKYYKQGNIRALVKSFYLIKNLILSFYLNL